MTKLSSNKRPAKSKKDAGCMWGLINLFDFRQGQRIPRLLSDKKSGNSSSRHTGNGYSRVILDSMDCSPKKNDADTANESRIEEVNLSSVRTLMEAEMSQHSSQKNVSNDKAQQVASETRFEIEVKKNNIQRSKKSKVISDPCVRDLTSEARPYNHHSSSSTDINTLNTDLTAFLIHFYSHGCQLQLKHGDHDSKDGACPNSEVTSEKLNKQLDGADYLFNEKQVILKKALADLSQMITSQSCSDEKTSKGFTQSNEFLNVLNALNTNKESFLKVLEHPDSLFLQQFKDFQDGQIGKYSKVKSDKYLEKFGLPGKDRSSGKVEEPDGSEPLHKQNRYSFFRKSRSKATMESQGSPSPQARNRIVVLKPNPDRTIRSAVRTSTSSSPQLNWRTKPDENIEKAIPFFSLKEMKRRIKNMFGESKKARHVISMDSFLHKIPIGSKDAINTDKLIVRNSTRKSSVDVELPSESVTISNKKEKEISQEESDFNIVTSVPLPVARNVIYEAGRKHLAEIVNNQRADEVNAAISKTLGRILSLPEYIGPSTTPSSESKHELLFSTKDHNLIPPKRNYQEDVCSGFISSEQNLVAESCSSSILHHEMQMLNLKVELFESYKLDTVGIKMNADQEGSRAPDIVHARVANKLDTTSSSNDYQVNAASEICEKEEESIQGLTETQTLCSSEFSTSLSSSESILSPVGSTVKSGSKSPASVLEKFYSEDVTCPDWMTLKHSRHQLKPRQLSYEDNMLPRTSSLKVEGHSKTYFGDQQARLAYVKAVLQASKLMKNEHSERWYWAEQLLEPSLFEEVESSCYHLYDDPKLLFDCINEVLSDVQERHYKMAFITQCVCPAPVGANLLEEVSKAIGFHLRAVLPNTVYQIMKRDMANGTWMSLRVEIEDIVIDIWDTLLDDLMEEAVFDLWLFDM